MNRRTNWRTSARAGRILVLAAACTAGSVRAADRYWRSGTDDWQNGAWSATPGGNTGFSAPASGDNAYIFNDATDITVTRGGNTPALTGLGTLGLDGTGGGVVSLREAYTFGQLGASTFVVGASGQAIFELAAGTSTSPDWIVGQQLGSAGTILLSSSGTFVINNGGGVGSMSIGVGGTGAVIESGISYVSFANRINIGSSTNVAGTGIYTLNNGTLAASTSGAQFDIGGAMASGEFDMNGGTALLHAFNVASFGASSGVVNKTGGYLQIDGAAGQLLMGNSAGTTYASFTQSGGSTTINAPVIAYQNTSLVNVGGSVSVGVGFPVEVLGGTVDLGTSPLVLFGGNALLMNDGYFAASNITSSNGTTVNFNAGTVAITASGLNLSTNQIFGAFGLSLPSGKAVIVSGATTVSPATPVAISGGTFSTGTLIGPNSAFQFYSGTFRLTGTTLDFVTGGLFGAAYALDNAHRLEVGNGNVAQIEAGAQLYVTGGALDASGGVNNYGYVQMSSPIGRVGGALFNNFGLLQGTGRILAPLVNNTGGEVRVTATDTLRCEGPDNSNSGLINLLGGVVDFTGTLENLSPGGRITGRGTLNTALLTNQGSILLSSGVSDVHGALVNNVGAKTIVSGNATASFYDDVTNDPGSEFRVSTNSTAVFFGTVTGLDQFTGPGVKDFEGDTLPGAIATSGSTLVGPIAHVIAQHVREAALSVEGSLTIVANGTQDGVSRVGALSIPGGQVDLTNNALIVDGTEPATINSVRAAIISGRAVGSWTGTGLISSSATANTFGLGYGLASDIFSAFPATFLGQSVDSTTALVRFTYYGDANLDGIVNTADFTALAAHFNQPGQFWPAGDFNYDGKVNALDFNAIATNYGQSLPSLARPGAGSLVPEPAVLYLLAACLLGPRHRPRRER